MKLCGSDSHYTTAPQGLQHKKNPACFTIELLVIQNRQLNGTHFILDKARFRWLDRRIVRKQLDIIPTYHYVQNQGKLIMQNREHGQKPQFGKFFRILRLNISKLQIFLKNRFQSSWRSYLVLTSGQKPKKS